MTDRLRDAVRHALINAGIGYMGAAATDHVYFAVKALALAEASEHDKALETLKGTLELAWRTLKREAPHIDRRTLAGAILALTDELRQSAAGERRADQEVERLEGQIRMLEAQIDRLKLELDKPGFQGIFRAIGKRAEAAKEQYDMETLWKLDQLHDAAKAMLTPNDASPEVIISFGYRIRPQTATILSGPDLRGGAGSAR